MHKRYGPQIRLEEIGEHGQKKLFASSVLIVGCGALGSPIAMYLAGAGIGKLTLADYDNVDMSNLHRQVFYSEKDLGKKKVECLKAGIMALNSNVSVEILDCLITRRVLDKIKDKFDIIVDAADNPSTTYMLSEYCKKEGLPLSIGGVKGWKAQVFTYIPGSLCYHEVIPVPENDGSLLPCSLTGITGPTSAWAASLQSSQVIKVLCGIEKKVSSLVTADLLNNSFSVFTC